MSSEQSYAIGDRVQMTTSDDGGLSRREVGPARGTVAEVLDSGRVAVDWDDPYDRKNLGIPAVLWPEDLEPLDLVSRLGELTRWRPHDGRG